MIVDGKGKIFEDRRNKHDEDRRKNTFDAEGGRRVKVRREVDRNKNQEKQSK